MNWGAAIRNLDKKISWLNKKLECHIRNSGDAFTQVQANWTETDTTSPSYILNKPTDLGGIDFGNLPSFDTMEEAVTALGPGQLFTWNEGNLEGEPSIEGSALAITKVT